MSGGYVDYIEYMRDGTESGNAEGAKLKAAMAGAGTEPQYMIFYRHYIAWLKNIKNTSSCTTNELITQLVLIHQYIKAMLNQYNPDLYTADLAAEMRGNEVTLRQSFDLNINLRDNIDDRIAYYYQNIVYAEKAFVVAATGLMLGALGILATSDLLFTSTVVLTGLGLAFGVSLFAAYICHVVSDKTTPKHISTFIESWVDEKIEERLVPIKTYDEDYEGVHEKTSYEKQNVTVPAHVESNEGVNWVSFKIKQKAKEAVVAEMFTVEKLYTAVETTGYKDESIKPALKMISELASVTAQSGIYTSYSDYKNGRGLMPSSNSPCIDLENLSKKLAPTM